MLTNLCTTGIIQSPDIQISLNHKTVPSIVDCHNLQSKQDRV